MKVLSVFASLVGAALVALPSFGLTLEGEFSGNTYHVSKTGSNGDAKSWATAKTTIQAAVALCGDGDTIVVDDGEYTETTDVSIADTKDGNAKKTCPDSRLHDEAHPSRFAQRQGKDAHRRQVVG